MVIIRNNLNTSNNLKDSHLLLKNCTVNNSEKIKRISWFFNRKLSVPISTVNCLLLFSKCIIAILSTQNYQKIMSQNRKFYVQNSTTLVVWI